MKIKKRFSAPTLDELRNWDNKQLTNLSWAYDKLRRSSGENKMFIQNWFNTLMKRIDIIRKERNL